MEGPAIGDVVQALQVQSDPTADKGSRQAAHALCEQVKAHDGYAFEVAGQLFNQSMPDTVRHFGLSLYEHLITKRWLQLGMESKAQMKEVAMRIVNQWPVDVATAPFLKHKAVQVVALIAKREWPHQWPALFTQLTQLSQHSDAHCEIVLLILGEMGEGLFSDDKMTDGRRNELLVALNAEFPALFSFCYKVLEDNFVRYRQPPDDVTRQTAYRMITAALKTFEAYAPLSSLAALCQCGVLNAVHALMGAEDLRENALDVLLVISAKKSKDAPAEVFGPFVLSLLSMCEAGLLNETEYAVHRRLCQAFKDIGCNHWYALVPQSCNASASAPLPAAALPEVAVKLMHLMAAFSNYEGLCLPNITTEFWRAMLDSPLSGGSRGAIVVLPEGVREQLLRAVLTKVSGKPTSEPEGGDAEDCDDLEDYLRLWGQVKAKMLEVSRKLAGAEAIGCLHFVGGHWHRLLAEAHEVCSGMRFLRVETWEQRVESACALLDAVVSGISPVVLRGAEGTDPALSSQINILCNQVIDMLLGVDMSRDAALVPAVRQGFIALIPYMRIHGGKGAAVLERLMSLLHCFPLPADPTAPPGGSDIIALRRRVAGATVKIGEALAPHLAPLASQVEAMVTQMVNEGKVTPEETAHLYELLFLLAGAASSANGPSADERIGFFHRIIEPWVTEWNGQEITDGVQDVEGWLVGAPVGSAPVSAEVWGANTKRRHRIHQVMITLLSICRRAEQHHGETAAAKAAAMGGSGGGGSGEPDGASKSASQAALEGQVGRVLLNLVRLVRSVHSLWDPALRSQLPPTWQQVVYRPVEYEAAVDGAAGAAAIATIIGDISAKGEEERRAMELCGWLRHVRDGAYQLLGVLASWGPDSAMFKVLASEGGAQMVSLMWEHLPYLEPRHLRSFIRLFLGNLIRNCPPQLHPALLQGIVPQVLGLLRLRLDEGYQAVSSGVSSGTDVSDIASDHVVRLLHREVVELLMSLVDGGQGLAAQAAALASIQDRATGVTSPSGKPWVGGGTGGYLGANSDGIGGAAGAGGAGVKRDGKGEGGTMLGQQLTEFVLTNAVVGPAVAELLTNAMVWPDSSGATRAATALQRMIPKIKHLPAYHQVLEAMLRVVLWGLGRVNARLPVGCTEAGMLHVLRDIYVNFVMTAPFVNQILLQLELADEAKLAGLQDAVLGKPMAEKKQRALLRQFVAANSPHDSAAPPPAAPPLGFGGAERLGALRSAPGDSGWSEEVRQSAFEWAAATHCQ